jgi:hypothetical protein
MTVRPPHSFSPKIWANSPAAALDYEIAQEKASALGRLGRALEAALAKLHAFDEATPAKTTETKHKRRTLVDQAGHALWLFVVQREAIGLRDTRALMREYRVPAEVFNRMGVTTAKSS